MLWVRDLSESWSFVVAATNSSRVDLDGPEGPEWQALGSAGGWSVLEMGELHFECFHKVIRLRVSRVFKIRHNGSDVLVARDFKRDQVFSTGSVIVNVSDGTLSTS